MKRCSQCDFVYEDEQGVCDMDGGELVYEPTLYPTAGTAIVVATRRMKFRSRSFILTAGATVIMGLFLGIGFFGLSERTKSPTSPATVTQPASVPVMVQPAMAATSSEPTPSPDEPVSPAANVKSRNAAAKTSSAAKPAATVSRSPSPGEVKRSVPAKTNQKEDSKVGSLLKKTGRILKKPFKF